MLGALDFQSVRVGAIATTLVLVAVRGGEALPPGNGPLRLLLLVTTVAFFVGFWIKGGQTLGMRAWRLQVRRAGGGALDARTALVRFAGGLLVVASLGLGLLWLRFDPARLPWHDRLAGTQVVVLPPRRRRLVSARGTPPTR